MGSVACVPDQQYGGEQGGTYSFRCAPTEFPGSPLTKLLGLVYHPAVMLSILLKLRPVDTLDAKGQA